jgi:hypothetical protein
VNDEEFNEKNYTKYVFELKADLANMEKKAENNISNAKKPNQETLNNNISNESVGKPNSNKNTKSFFQRNLKDYLNGELTCVFCNAKTLPWPIANQHNENQQVSKQFVINKRLLTVFEFNQVNFFSPSRFSN